MRVSLEQIGGESMVRMSRELQHSFTWVGRKKVTLRDKAKCSKTTHKACGLQHQITLFCHSRLRNLKGIKFEDLVLQNRTLPLCRNIFKLCTCMMHILSPHSCSALCSMRLTFMGSPALCTRPRLWALHLPHRLAFSLLQLKQRWTWFQNCGVNLSFYFRPRELLSWWLIVLQTGHRHDPQKFGSCFIPLAHTR